MFRLRAPVGHCILQAEDWLGVNVRPAGTGLFENITVLADDVDIDMGADMDVGVDVYVSVDWPPCAAQ